MGSSWPRAACSEGLSWDHRLASSIGCFRGLCMSKLSAEGPRCRGRPQSSLVLSACFSQTLGLSPHPASSVMNKGSPGTCLCKCLLELATGPPPSGTQRGLAEPHLGTSRCRLEHTWELSRCLLEGNVSASLGKLASAGGASPGNLAGAGWSTPGNSAGVARRVM